MIIKVTFKDPDALDYAIEEALDGLKIDSLDEAEVNLVMEKRSKEIREACSEWFEYGEYVELHIDTEKGTCIVKKPE